MTTGFRQGVLRPSSLPKLALCSWFRSPDGEAGAPSEAAARGTRIDTIYRDMMTGLMDFPNGSSEEIATADWGAGQTDIIAGKHKVLAQKKDCQVMIPGFPAPGEVDALCPKLLTSIDLKTGQWYDYRLQMAAYAWGLMTKYFAETWTTWLLFCDLRRASHYTFTYAEARDLVLEVRARYEAAPPPAFNPYCTWCANAAECPALINRAEHALALTEKPRFDFTAVLADPDRLGAFLHACRAVEPYQQQANDRAKQYLHGKIEVPGWRLVTRGPGKYVEPAAVQPLLDKLGAHRVLEEYGHLSVAKYAKLCEAAGIQPDQSLIRQGAGSTYLWPIPQKD